MASVTRNKVVAISVALLVVGLVVGAIVGTYTIPPREVPKEVTRTVTKEVVRITTAREIVTTTKEVPKEVVKEAKEVLMKLSVLVEKIRRGEIEVGEMYGMAPDQRYHRIHAATLGLKCSICHVEKVSPEMIFAQTPPKAPGPVDRRVCLGCHLTGPASNLYGP